MGRSRRIKIDAGEFLKMVADVATERTSEFFSAKSVLLAAENIMNDLKEEDRIIWLTECGNALNRLDKVATEDEKATESFKDIQAMYSPNETDPKLLRAMKSISKGQSLYY